MMLEHQAIIPKEQGKDRVFQTLRDAGVAEEFLQQHAADLPRWDDIVQQYGAQPVLWGLDSCVAFRERVPAVQRMLAGE